MSIFSRLCKGAALLTRPGFARAAVRHRIAAAVEHLDVIELTAAATLVDIGANKGQFSLAFQQLRPNAQIIAFEPLPQAADRYEALFAGDETVTLHRVALSDAAGRAVFHVADREDSSSLLKPGAGQSRAFGVSGAATIDVPVDRLDARVALASLPRPILVKIDVQGAELSALKGCDDLECADFVYVELSFVELYESQPLFSDVATYLMGRGFTLAGVYNQITTVAFGPTQADFLFKHAGA